MREVREIHTHTLLSSETQDSRSFKEQSFALSSISSPCCSFPVLVLCPFVIPRHHFEDTSLFNHPTYHHQLLTHDFLVSLPCSHLVRFRSCCYHSTDSCYSINFNRLIVSRLPAAVHYCTTLANWNLHYVSADFVKYHDSFSFTRYNSILIAITQEFFSFLLGETENDRRGENLYFCHDHKREFFQHIFGLSWKCGGDKERNTHIEKDIQTIR